MTRVVILGAGAAPGVPSLSYGWGDCNPENPRNIRRRTSVYYDFDGTHILIDTSPDLRQQLLDNQIKHLDGVLYTHKHADHLHGLDDLREVNRIMLKNINIYAQADTMAGIRERFSYMLTQPDHVNNVIRRPSLIPNQVEWGRALIIKNISIVPMELSGHNAVSTGYILNGGEIVHLADFKSISPESLRLIKRRPKLLIIPLTTPFGQPFHAGLGEVLEYIEKINPERTIINHMAAECDYDEINSKTPDNVFPAYDNMIIEIKD